MTLLLWALAGALGLAVLFAAGRRSTAAEHSSEYRDYLQSSAWRATARRSLDLTKRRCCLFPWLRATHAHHMHYRNLRREWAIRDLVPLSSIGHRVAHAWICWRGPGRVPLTAWMRLTTISLAIVVRPWLAVTLLALAVSGGVALWQACPPQMLGEQWAEARRICDPPTDWAMAWFRRMEAAQ